MSKLRKHLPAALTPAQREIIRVCEEIGYTPMTVEILMVPDDPTQQQPIDGNTTVIRYDGGPFVRLTWAATGAVVQLRVRSVVLNAEGKRCTWRRVED